MARLLKVVEVSNILGISRSKVYDMARSKKIPVVIIDGCVRVPEGMLRRWIESNTYGVGKQE